METDREETEMIGEQARERYGVPPSVRRDVGREGEPMIQDVEKIEFRTGLEFRGRHIQLDADTS